MRKFVTKKRALAAGVAVLVAGGSMAAYAYFTSTGSGSGSAGVGSATAWSVTGSGGSGSPSSTGTMYPGAGTASLTYRVTNAGTGHQGLTGVSVVVADDGSGNVFNGAGAAVPGCLSTWFAVNNAGSVFKDSANATVTLPQDLAASGYITGTTTVTMNNVNSSQDLCQGVSPRLTVNAT